MQSVCAEGSGVHQATEVLQIPEYSNESIVVDSAYNVQGAILRIALVLERGEVGESRSPGDIWLHPERRRVALGETESEV